MVVQANNIACHSHIGRHPLGGKKGDGVMYLQGAPNPHVPQAHAFAVAP